MNKTGLLLTLLLTTSISFSQEMKTLFKKDTAASTDSYGGYGAPFVGGTQLNNEFATIVGGKGAVIKNHVFAFGGVGTAIISSKKTSFNKFVLDSSGLKISNYNGSGDSTTIDTKTITMGYGGIFIEYVFNYTSPVHISLPLNIQVGGVKAGDDNDDMAIKSSSFFVLEPGINFEFNFYKNFIPSLNVGYRYVSGSYSSSLSGLYGSLIFKFGKF